MVPPTGATIQSIYLPPGTHVRTATYAIARSSSNFDAPDEFKPERWLPSDSSLAPEGKAAFNPKASVPFLLGPYNCVGRNFALMEMRATVATLVRRYDMRLVERFDKERFDRMIEDRSVLEIEGALDVIVTRRAIVQDKS
jgi:cytochrome P450